MVTTERQLGRLYSRSPLLFRVFDRIAELAASDTTILIQGETGTGKELAAEALHEHSPRESGPYVVVDCASIPRELIEAELFGHEKGAFTGAVEARAGAFEAGSGGTVFIDEIGELPLDLQPRLLRVLEKREVRRVGSQKSINVDVRVVAATNRDLSREVNEGRFRQDLYFRLDVVRVQIPALRDRPEDVLFLAERFLEENFGAGGMPIKVETQKRLLAHSWPGNVRELRNVIERGAAMSDRDLRLPEDFGSSLLLDAPDGLAPGSGVGLGDDPTRGPAVPYSDGSQTRPLWDGKSFKDGRDAVLADFERGYVTALLEAHQGNVSAAARAAGIHRNILHRLIARYRITSKK